MCLSSFCCGIVIIGVGAMMYIMVAYAKKFNCSSIALCYPDPGNNKQYKPYTDGEITVYIRTLDLSILRLSDDISQIKEKIQEIIY